ncbi:hypothetical protein M1439_04085 [Candidatus Marsarchaeota archaeon]|jgi:uridylate kinase|nr:hypothetical protein [Candidatus Marsarchaeota archaeon]
MAKTVIVSLGGSFLFSHSNALPALKQKLMDMRGFNFGIIVGGGRLARNYIDFARKLGLAENALHTIGIMGTDINAFMISKYFNCALYCSDPRLMKFKSKIVVSGGFKPGWTTDVCSAYAAVSSGSKVIFNISKERGVYTKDPKAFKNARLIKEINASKLIEMMTHKRTAGVNYIFDPMASKICRMSGIRVVVTNSVFDIFRYLNGLQVKGTIIEPK